MRRITGRTYLSSLNDGERDALMGLGVSRRLPRGSVLLFQGESDERVLLLLDGRVKVERVDDEGESTLLSIRDPGDLLGELAHIDGQPRVATVCALEPVVVQVMAADAFRSHLEHTPRLAVLLLEVVVRRFREATLRHSEFAALDTTGRLASRLLELGDRYGEDADEGVAIALPLTREELAAWTGASRAGVAHALQSMRDLGWIESEGRRLRLTNREALTARARRPGAPDG
jgi:CRP/FNR family transcriptional regulator, cyclic AMP receptor protein